MPGLRAASRVVPLLYRTRDTCATNFTALRSANLALSRPECFISRKTLPRGAPKPSRQKRGHSAFFGVSASGRHVSSVWFPGWRMWLSPALSSWCPWCLGGERPLSARTVFCGRCGLRVRQSTGLQADSPSAYIRATCGSICDLDWFQVLPSPRPQAWSEATCLQPSFMPLLQSTVSSPVFLQTSDYQYLYLVPVSFLAVTSL